MIFDFMLVAEEFKKWHDAARESNKDPANSSLAPLAKEAEEVAKPENPKEEK